MNLVINDARKAKIKKYSGQYIIGIVRWLFILGICFVILYPLFTKISASFMSVTDLYDATVKYFPKSPSLSNYNTAMIRLGFPNVFFSSFGLAFTTSLLQTATATLVGYGLARYKFKGRGIVFGIVILNLVLLPDLLFTPRYVMFSDLQDGFLAMFGLNTWWPMILFAVTCTGLKCSLYIFMMRQFFRGMPKELEEAAYVDGAGALKTFVVIMLPSAVAMMVTCFLFSFVWQWLDMSYTTIFAKDLPFFSTRVGFLTATAGGGITSNVDLTVSLIKNAGMILIMLPLLALYLFTQKFFVESIARSGLVG